jgi:hypothetical protein
MTFCTLCISVINLTYSEQLQFSHTVQNESVITTEFQELKNPELIMIRVISRLREQHFDVDYICQLNINKVSSAYSSYNALGVCTEKVLRP